MHRLSSRLRVGQSAPCLTKRSTEAAGKAGIEVMFFCGGPVTAAVPLDTDMITRAQADAIAAQYVAALTQNCELGGFTLNLVDNATEEYEIGWLFFCYSSDPGRVPIAGNSPLIVERKSGNVLETGTAYAIQHYIDNYLATGDPHGSLGHDVRLSGYNYGARKIDATKAIREHLGIGLGDAKQIVENCLDGASVVLTAKSGEDAVSLETELKAALFVAERIPASAGRTKP